MDRVIDSTEGDLEKCVIMVKKTKRTWYGKEKVVEVPQIDYAAQETGPEKRPAVLYAPFYNGVAAALSFRESSYLPKACDDLTFPSRIKYTVVMVSVRVLSVHCQSEQLLTDLIALQRFLSVSGDKTRHSRDLRWWSRCHFYLVSRLYAPILDFVSSNGN